MADHTCLVLLSGSDTLVGPNPVLLVHLGWDGNPDAVLFDPCTRSLTVDVFLSGLLVRLLIELFLLFSSLLLLLGASDRQCDRLLLLLLLRSIVNT